MELREGERIRSLRLHRLMQMRFRFTRQADQEISADWAILLTEVPPLVVFPGNG